MCRAVLCNFVHALETGACDAVLCRCGFFGRFWSGLPELMTILRFWGLSLLQLWTTWSGLVLVLSSAVLLLVFVRVHKCLSLGVGCVTGFPVWSVMSLPGGVYSV